MLKEDRLEFILKQLKSGHSVKLPTLSGQLKVSEDTIRRDIDSLAKEGLLTKVRGGAIPHSPNAHSFKERLQLFEEEKKRIAQKALQLIEPGQTILLDGGTTTYALADLLQGPLTVITNNIPAAALLAGRKNIELVLAGGQVLPDSMVTAGTSAISFIEKLHVDICFIGVCSIHHEIGVSSIDYFECEMKRAMVAVADRIVALTGHDKVGTAEPYRICPITDLETIVTEIDPDHEIFDLYRDKNIRIL